MHASKMKCLLSVLVVSIGLTTALLSSNASGSGDRWYQVGLTKGETSGGYRWAVGAKGRKDEALKEICTSASMVEPLQDDLQIAEGEDATDCGSLRHPTDSVSSTVSFETGTRRVSVLVIAYRPIIRKVTFVLATGERKVYRPLTPHIPERVDQGIPVFRYMAASFEGETCVRRIITFDGRGEVVGGGTKPPCAHRGNV